MRLEQRIGRVDRLGQESPQVLIFNLVHSGTIDAEIYHRLYERLKLSERALGEFEPVLGEPIREMTQKLLDPRLSYVKDRLEIAAFPDAALRPARRVPIPTASFFRPAHTRL